jgi:hypothetical protein
MHEQRCPHCKQVWFDQTTDFGGKAEESFVLQPVLGAGIEVRVGGRVVCVVNRDELQDFLDRAYGPRAS